MKHFARMALLLLPAMAVLAGCGVTANSFSARSRYIEGGRIKEQPKAAEIDVDFSQRVTAQSDWQASKSAARTEAEHKAITGYGIDIVVEPVWKYTTSPMFSRQDGAPWYTCYKAELIGFAGKYRKTLSTEERIQQLQDIDLETIEKYKLLTDPDFKDVYYQSEPQPADNSVKGSVIINGGFGAPVAALAPDGLQKSLVVKPVPKQPKPVKVIDYYQRGTSKVKAGKTFFSMSTICWAIAAGTGVAYQKNEYSFGESHEAYSLFVTTHIFGSMGILFDVIGIPCWIAGAKDLQRANNPSLTFNYQVAPTGINLALNF